MLLNIIKRITLILIFLFSLNTLYARDLYQGQIVSGTIGNFGLNTKINLPYGEWVVAGMAKKNGTIRPVDLFLIQSYANKIKAIMIIRYARGKGKSQGWDYVNGWSPEQTFENNTCDDYENQNSNYHYKKINKKRQHLIINGACLAVYAKNISNMFDLSMNNLNIDAVEMTQNYIEINALKLPNALVFIDNTYYIEENYVQTYFAVNPEFKGIKSNPAIYNKSKWHKLNISADTSKFSYMSRAIQIGKTTLDKNKKILDSSNRRALDFINYSALHDPFIPNTTKKKTEKKAEKKVQKKKIEPETSNIKDSKLLIKFKLKELKSLLTDGLITQEQYEDKSEEIMKDF